MGKNIPGLGLCGIQEFDLVPVIKFEQEVPGGYIFWVGVVIRFHIFEYIPNVSNNTIRPIKDGKTCSDYNRLNSDDEI